MARAELPKYQAIASDLRERFEAGEFSPGDQLASQQELASRYGVTIMTLRQALAELERDGLVRTARGKGTFVAEPSTVSFGLDHLSSFAQEMASQGVQIETHVVAVELEPLGPDVDAARLALGTDGSGSDPAAGDPGDVVTIVRRRSIDGLPVVVQRSTLHRTLWDAVCTADLTTASLYATLAERAGVRVERATETFRAVALGPADAAHLEAPEGTACLESTRVSFAEDRAFLVDRAVMLGSASEIRAERSADALHLGYSTPT